MKLISLSDSNIIAKHQNTEVFTAYKYHIGLVWAINVLRGTSSYQFKIIKSITYQYQITQPTDSAWTYYVKLKLSVRTDVKLNKIHYAIQNKNK